MHVLIFQWCVKDIRHIHVGFLRMTLEFFLCATLGPQFIQSNSSEHIHFFPLLLYIRLAFKIGLRLQWCLTSGWTNWCLCCPNVLCIFLQIFIPLFDFKQHIKPLQLKFHHFLSATQCFEVWSNSAAAAKPQHPRHHQCVCEPTVWSLWQYMNVLALQRVI